MTDNERWHPLNHAGVTRQREGRNSVRPIFRPNQSGHSGRQADLYSGKGILFSRLAPVLALRF